MFFIPGFLIALVTFPGVIVHEMAHQLFCRLFRVAVLDVCYFRLGNPSGYVLHESPRTTAQHLVIGIGPFLDLAVGRYDFAKSEIDAGGSVSTLGGSIGAKAFHVWGIFGVRATMLP